MSDTTSSSLAILGGPPRFARPLHVGCPNLGDRDAFTRRINAAWDAHRLTNDGPLVRELEQRIADLIGVRHAVATCNGTAALEIAIRALELTGEVIVPAFTFIATVHALTWLGLTPVFCDADPETHALDPAQVSRLITPRTSAILAVNVWGNAAAPEALEQLARTRGLRLFFDSAHAFGCEHRGRMIGSFGDLEVFSFHATKFVHSGEGGAVVTNSDDLAGRLKLLRNFGFVDYDSVAGLGINAKLSELHAAMGLTSLDSLDRFVTANRTNYVAYEAALVPLPGLRLHPRPESARHNHQYVVVEVDPAVAPLTRDELLRVLQAEGVLARRYFYPGCHRVTARLHPAVNPLSLPVTDRLCETILQLPTGTNVNPAQIAIIGDVLQNAWREAPLIRASTQCLG